MPKALSTVGDRQRFCQEQRPVLAEQVSGMEHDAFHVPVSLNKTLEAAFNGQARTRRPSASTAVAARARPRGPRAGPSPPTTAGETGCGRPPTAAAAAAADKPAQAEPLACIPTRMLSVPFSASQPRVIQYIANNVLSVKDADFVDAVPGEFLRTIGQDRDSYRAFLAEIERRDRDGAIVIVSATHEGEYLVNPPKLQRTLVGLAHVVQVLPGANSYEMVEILGQPWSAWSGAVNVLAIPSPSGVRSRYFLHDAIQAWGEELQRISQILAWVTASTNIPRLRMHVRPEGVTQLSMRRRIEKVRATSAQMTAAQLRQALDEAAKRAADQEGFFNEIVEENAGLEAELARYKDDLAETQDTLRRESFQLKSLKDDRFSSVGDDSGAAVDPEVLLEAVLEEELSPLDCLELIEHVYVNRCTVLDSARSSARKMTRFIPGRELLDLLKRLVTTYRDQLVDGGDTKARQVFGKNEYAAKESETVMKNKVMRRQRIFDYDGTQVEMFSHLKIGVEDDPTRTIRVHFHWDGDRQKIAIGYCGEHLPVSSR